MASCEEEKQNKKIQIKELQQEMENQVWQVFFLSLSRIISEFLMENLFGTNFVLVVPGNQTVQNISGSN